jgi:hypothetical protein
VSREKNARAKHRFCFRTKQKCPCDAKMQVQVKKNLLAPKTCAQLETHSVRGKRNVVLAKNENIYDEFVATEVYVRLQLDTATVTITVIVDY